MKKLNIYKSLLFVLFLILISVLSTLLLCRCEKENVNPVKEAEVKVRYIMEVGGTIEGKLLN